MQKVEPSKETADKVFITPAPQEVKLPVLSELETLRKVEKSPDLFNISHEINREKAAVPRNLPAINSFESPLIHKDEKKLAVEHGYSFGSKKVAMGPAFFNLRLICDCLGRALRRHMDYSYGVFWFLDDLQKAKKVLKKQQKEGTDTLADSGVSDVTAFSYGFNENLKLNQQINDRETSLDRDSVAEEIDDMDLEIANTLEA